MNNFLMKKKFSFVNAVVMTAITLFISIKKLAISFKQERKCMSLKMSI